MASAAIIIEEVNDQVDLIQSRLDKLTKNVKRLQAGQVVNTVERRKLIDSCDKDMERTTTDIRSINYDLKRLPKDREQDY